MLPSTTFAEDRLEDMLHRARGERATVGIHDVAQDERLAIGVKDRPFAPLLDAADQECQFRAMVEQTQQLPVQAVDLLPHRRKLRRAAAKISLHRRSQRWT